MEWRYLCRAVLLLTPAAAGCVSVFDEVSRSPVVRELQRSASLDATEPIAVTVADAAGPDLSGVRRVAVLDFAGGERTGEWVAGGVCARLGAGSRFEVIDPPTVQKALRESGAVLGGPIGAETAARVGRGAGADAVLVGELITLDAGDDGVQQNQHAQTASLVLDYRLIETASGRVLLAGRATPSTSLRVAEAGPSSPQILTRLSDRCADLVVAELTDPGRRTVLRRFARHWGNVNRGNVFARQGAFDIAQKLYQKAVTEDPRNDAAWYNLGLVLESAGDPAGAEEHFRKAMALRECDLYIAAFQRARGAAARPS